jgi:hypothetical protein
MAACGIPQVEIARCLGEKGIDAKTLRKHFEQELETASIKANSVVANRLYLAAERGEPWAVCFWLKTRAKFRETDPRPGQTAPDAPNMQGDFTFHELLTTFTEATRRKAP